MMIWPESCWKWVRWLLIKRQEVNLKVRFDFVVGEGMDIHSLWVEACIESRGMEKISTKIFLSSVNTVERARIRKSCQCEREREGFEERGDREIGAYGKGLVCQLGEAWDHCPVLLCTIIPLNPALLLTASYYTHTPPPITHLHTHLTVLFIDDSSLPFSFRIHSQHWSSGTSGPNGLISTVYSCALSRMTHKGTKRPLCVRESFSYSRQQDLPTRTVPFLRKPSCLSSLWRACRLLSVCSSSHSNNPRLSSFHLTGGSLPCHLSPLRPTVTFFLLCWSMHPFI